MRRRLILVGVLAMALAACGGSSGTPSPSASGAAGSSATTSGSPSSPTGASNGPTPSGSVNAASPSASVPAAGSTSTAACDGITLRKAPASTGAKVKVINSGTSVHVAATVNGSAYTAGACGTSGSTWLKIDKVGSKSAKSLYGVTYVYAAAGFFQ